MQNLEVQSTLTVALIFFCRMMGLFMVLPVLSLYGYELEGATPFLLGLALGIYGISQAGFQIPFAILSDVFGRKLIMLTGLMIFFIGSLMSIFADSIWLLICSRFLQGAGAIAATSMAFLADNSRIEIRARAMAVVGIAIGSSFVLALVAGPWIAFHSGLKGVFIVSSILAAVALLSCAVFVKEREKKSFKNSWFVFKKLKFGQVFKDFVSVIRNRGVLFFSFSVFALHLVMTASFIVVPVLLETHFELLREQHWMFYLGVFIVSVILMGPFARPSSDLNKLSTIFHGCAVTLFLVLLFLGLLPFSDFIFFALALVIFFTAFNLMEALLPSLLSIIVEEKSRAQAMGVYSSFQFFGAFMGGTVAGLTLQVLSSQAVFLVGAFVLFLVLLMMALSESRFQYHQDIN